MDYQFFLYIQCLNKLLLHVHQIYIFLQFQYHCNITHKCNQYNNNFCYLFYKALEYIVTIQVNKYHIQYHNEHKVLQVIQL